MKLQNILSFSGFYRAFSALVGAYPYRQRMVRDFIRPEPGCRILDIGCGPADILDHLGQVDYTGFDANPHYIEAARTRHGNRGTFVCGAVKGEHELEDSTFDRVLALGVLHHLDDAEADDLFALSARALKPAGFLLTLDGCFLNGQSFAESFLLRQDRGRFVRDEHGYRALAARHFPYVKTEIHRNLLNIPYTHLIMECRLDTPPDARRHIE